MSKICHFSFLFELRSLHHWKAQVKNIAIFTTFYSPFSDQALFIRELFLYLERKSTLVSCTGEHESSYSQETPNSTGKKECTNIKKPEFTIQSTYWEKSIHNGYSDIESFLQQTESIVDLYQPVNQNGSHSFLDFGSLAHISWWDVEFTLNRKVTKKYHQQREIAWYYKEI